jgi:hypothetical protein
MEATRGRFGFFIFIVVAGFMFVALLMGSGNQAVQESSNQLLVAVDQAQPQFKVSDHGLDKHTEATLIQECLNNKGPYQVWRDKYDSKTFYALCQYDNDKWGLAVCTDTGINKTAFSPNSGTRDDVFGYVMKLATRFTKGLPKGCK